MVLPFSLSKPQRNGEFFISILFVVYLIVSHAAWGAYFAREIAKNLIPRGS
jgi:hypothetical protein